MSQGYTVSRGASRRHREYDSNLRARKWHRYEPLDPRNRKAIRVIRVKSSLRDGLIDCELWHTSLDSDYSTLSYVWGTANSTKTILLNKRLCSVGENLWEFLRTARRHFAGTVLWIDALCIAQHDQQEKNHQVQMMSRIYSGANEVLVWLGPDTSQAGYALDIIHDFPRMRDREVIRDCVKNKHFWKGFREIYDAPYWQRAWIVQEFILPRRGLLVQGEHWVSLETFDIATNSRFELIFENFGRADFGLESWQLYYNLIEPGRSLLQMRDHRAAGRKRRPGDWNQGLMLKPGGCSDIRDRVFAILVFTTHGHSFKVDYALNPFELLLESVWLEHSGGFGPELTCRDTAGALNLTPASIMMYTHPAKRKFKCPAHSQIVDLPNDAEILHQRSAQSGAQLMEELLLIPHQSKDNSAWITSSDLTQNHWNFLDLPRDADLEIHMGYRFSSVNLMLAVYFGNHSRSNALRKLLPGHSNKEKPAARGLPTGHTDTEFMAHRDRYCYARGIYTAQCTPRPMKVYWMLWNQSASVHYYDRYFSTARIPRKLPRE